MRHHFAICCAAPLLAFVWGCTNQVDQGGKPAPAGEHPKHADAPAGETKITQAVAVLTPIGNSGVKGIVRFTRTDDSTQIHGTIHGLKPGKHGFHVHQFGDLTDAAKGMSAGGHFNPTGQPHGNLHDPHRHVGDFGNIEADEHGDAVIAFDDPIVALEGPQSIVGRALVVHALPDKFTQPTGDAGDRVAFGVIGAASPPVEQ
jgi:Cu-Zn family superoxide dismutase